MVAITAVELRRFLRDRSNIFFVFIFPLLLVLVIGSQFGGDGSAGRITVAGEAGELRTALVTELEDDGVAVTFADRDGMLEQVARGRTDVGLIVDGEAAAAFESGDDVSLEMIAGSGTGAPATVQRARTAVQAVTAQEGQLAALTGAGLGEDEAREALAAAGESVTPPTMEVVDVDEIAQEFSGLGQFDLGAGSQVLLFVFLTSLAGSATLIQARRHGVMGRTLAAPVSTTQALGGQALGRLAIAVFQGGYIMAATALLFDVDWGNLGLSLLVLLFFSAVSAGAAMVIGALVDNDGAATGLGVGFGLVLGAMGGCMFPLELFPDTLQTIAHVTPHAWAYEAFAEIQRHEGTLVDVLPQLGVLAAMAAVLLGLGSWALRRSLARAM
ncbi:ABC transporter permease [Georgenia subflava]|uniref:ABC transporter permease subunit n=1 Tax=Georgenia subflava TaxID=1622177 RepID=A0A6N7EG07_9MICO|nr:ABC transporter permease [Georgenia subflava]MPV36331.1 ABC transporter permease subunit [Georgenia subflava]